MKKYGLRVLVGLFTFAFSVLAFWLIVSTFTLPERFGRENKPEVMAVISNGTVEINFIGFGRIENRPTIKLEIINHTSGSVEYWAIKKSEPEIYVRLNGNIVNKIPGLICLEEDKFPLMKNESLKVEIFADLLTFKFLKEKGNFEFGFYFDGFEKNNKHIWSEPITISEKIKKEIIKMPRISFINLK